MKKNIYKIGKELFITSDEEIKANEWFYCSTLKRPQVFGHDNIPKDRGFKKIILTTDQDLIKDSVQAIDDEFLEWFVKNPSCEFVQLLRVPYFDESGFSYKIIIPKEESKQECSWSDIEEGCVNDECECEKKEILSQEEIKMEDIFNEEKKKGVKEFINKLKQETLEEFAERAVKEHPDFKAEGFSEYQNGRFNGIIEGAKWQEQRMYSEEEVHKIVSSYQAHATAFGVKFTYDKWFEQFKKK